jgi:hypothetical protein
MRAGESEGGKAAGGESARRLGESESKRCRVKETVRKSAKVGVWRGGCVLRVSAASVCAGCERACVTVRCVQGECVKVRVRAAGR